MEDGPRTHPTEDRPQARAILVAAGRSTRMASSAGVRKPLLELAGRPLLLHTLERFEEATTISSIVIVAHPEDVEAVQTLAQPVSPKLVAVVPGGAERIDSVRHGVEARPTRPEPPHTLVAIHDAARPFVTPAAIDAVNRAAAARGAALLAIPVRDTLKRSEDGRSAHSTVDRSGLFAAQTPQSFDAARFHELLERAHAEGLVPTDDASLWETYVGPVPLVPGDPTNFKVTDPTDLARARDLLEHRAANSSPRTSPSRTSP